MEKSQRTLHTPAPNGAYAVLRTLGALCPEGHSCTLRSLCTLRYQSATKKGVVSQSSSASQRGEPWRA